MEAGNSNGIIKEQTPKNILNLILEILAVQVFELRQTDLIDCLNRLGYREQNKLFSYKNIRPFLTALRENGSIIQNENGITCRKGLWLETIAHLVMADRYKMIATGVLTSVPLFKPAGETFYAFNHIKEFYRAVLVAVFTDEQFTDLDLVCRSRKKIKKIGSAKATLFNHPFLPGLMDRIKLSLRWKVLGYILDDAQKKPRPKRCSKGRDPLFFLVLALLGSEDADDLYLGIRCIIHLPDTREGNDSSIAQLSKAMRHLFYAQIGKNFDPEIFPKYLISMENPVVAFFSILVLSWRREVSITPYLSLLEKIQEKTMGCGYEWLTAEIHALLEGNQDKEASRQLRKLIRPFLLRRMKTEVLKELPENQHKALVFSQFVGHLAILRRALDKENITYQYLDGSTSAKKRKERINDFQNGKGDFFLISLKAGGTGLNLTAADYVIHMDPWWNPAVEDQASDRAHRIGQTRPVTVYRLVVKNTIEERIVDLHKEKRALAESLLAGSETAGRLSASALLALMQGEKEDR